MGCILCVPPYFLLNVRESITITKNKHVRGSGQWVKNSMHRGSHQPGDQRISPVGEKPLHSTDTRRKKATPLDSGRVSIKLYLERCSEFENSVRQALGNVRGSPVSGKGYRPPDR